MNSETTNRKRLTNLVPHIGLWLGLLLLLLAIVLVRFFRIGDNSSLIVAQDRISITITDTETLLIHPQAINVQESPHDERSPWRRILGFFVPESLDEVVSYYSIELSRRGWTVRRDEKGTDWRIIGFYWTEPNGKWPWHPDLTVSFNNRGNKTKVGFWYERTPDIANIPVIPNSTVLTNTEIKDAMNVPVYTRTFRTQYKPVEVLAFYKDQMPLYGWWVFDASTTQGPGLNLWFDRDGASILRAGEASIKVTVENEATIVDIHAR